MSNPTPFGTAFTQILPSANDGLKERMAKLEARTLSLEAADDTFLAGSVFSFNGRTGVVSFQLSDITNLGADPRYVLKSGDTMTGSLAISAGNLTTANSAAIGTSVVAGVQLTVQDAAASTFLFINNNQTPGGAAGSGGVAALILRSTTLASYGWRVVADGAVDQLLFSDESVTTRAWIPAQANSAFGIGSPSGTGVLMHTTADGRLLLTNVAATDFGRLQLGGTTSAFPALKRNGTGVDIRLADDSGYSPLVSGAHTIALAAALVIPSGTNTRAGNATLVGGTVTVANTTVTADSIVMLTRKTSGGTLGTAITYTLAAGASFTINSDSVLDTSTFSYFIIERP